MTCRISCRLGPIPKANPVSHRRLARVGCCASVVLSLLLAACSPPNALQSSPTAVSDPVPSTTSPPPQTSTPVPARPTTLNQNTGTLAGRVTIGPLSPGPVRLGITPPPIPPEVFAARTIQIYASDGATLVTSVKINSNGTYSVTLPPGNYVVDLARNGIDRGRDLPKKIQIEPSKSVQLDIDIDTGIR